MRTFAVTVAAIAAILVPAPASANFNEAAALDTTQVMSAEENELANLLTASDALFNQSVAWRDTEGFILWYEAEVLSLTASPAHAATEWKGLTVGKRIACASAVETDSRPRGEFAHCDGPTLSRAEVILCKRSQTVAITANTARCVGR
jgi:hypothetical protein